MLENIYVQIPTQDVTFLALKKVSLEKACLIGFREFQKNVLSFSDILNEIEDCGLYPETHIFKKVRFEIHSVKMDFVAEELKLTRRLAARVCLKKGIEILRAETSENQMTS